MKSKIHKSRYTYKNINILQSGGYIKLDNVKQKYENRIYQTIYNYKTVMKKGYNLIC